MGLRGILVYSLRAAVFAAAAGVVYALYCRLLRRKFRLERLLGVMYIAALVQITVLRGGVDWLRVLHEARPFPQFIPLKTTLQEAESGLWPLIYHTLGNIGWFAPLGVILRRRGVCRVVLRSALFSAGIELAQYILMTGMTDIDDVILNTLGALVGWLAMQCIKKHGFV